MVKLKATNEFVFIIRDKTETEKAGLIIPGAGREKPHVGTVVTVGATVKDGNIKSSKGKKALFHKGIGFEVEYEGVVYLVLQAHEILAIV